MFTNEAKLALSHRNITSWAVWIYVVKILTKVSVADLGEGPPYFLLLMLANVWIRHRVCSVLPSDTKREKKRL